MLRIVATDNVRPEYLSRRTPGTLSIQTIKMRFHRFFIQGPIGDKTRLRIESAELVNQFLKVFRLKIGDRLIVFDGSGFDYQCEIVDVFRSHVELHIVRNEKSRFVPERNVTLYAALVKKDTFEWIVEKATELGATRIVPVMAERSEKKSLNEERLKKIAVEASEQSGRGTVPEIGKIADLSQAIDDAERILNMNKIFGAEVLAFSTSEVPPRTSPRWNLCSGCFIGPEGGWSPREMEMFHSHGITVLSLGKQILRSETAAITALSLILLGQ